MEFCVYFDINNTDHSDQENVTTTDFLRVIFLASHHTIIPSTNLSKSFNHPLAFVLKDEPVY